jgi:hypothetical protein
MPEPITTGALILGGYQLGKTFIEKVDKNCGGAFKIWLEGKAKKQAAIDVAAGKGEAAISEAKQKNMAKLIAQEGQAELAERAVLRKQAQAEREQENLEAIFEKTAGFLKEPPVHADQLDDDWLTNFFEKSCKYSDEQMQVLWAKILVGEATEAGTFSRATVNIMANLSRSDAQEFQKLCCFAWEFKKGDTELVIPNPDDFGLNYNTLTNLDALGLISKDNTGHMKVFEDTERAARYFDLVVIIRPKHGKVPFQLRLGPCLFTRAGRELAPICKLNKYEGVFEKVLACWESVLDLTNAKHRLVVVDGKLTVEPF